MRKKFVVGNWKMNLTQAEALSNVEALVGQIGSIQSVDMGVCPTYLSIPKVREALKRTNIKLGGQDVFWAEKGAHTGEVSAPMLADAGVQICIAGHSETRGRFGSGGFEGEVATYFAESDASVNLKLKALLYNNIVPILCVGEILSEREAGHADGIIERQLRRGLEGIESFEFRDGVVAYEPVWAIGTGKVCDAAEASRVCGRIRAVLKELIAPETADVIRILYGGSVRASNSRELFTQANIDGGLVGGASLDPEEFCRVVLSAT